MHDLVYHNGRILPLREVRLSPGQAGLFNGWGLFTTLRVYDGQPFAFDRHWRRIQLDAQRTDTPFDFEERDLLDALQNVVVANDARQCCSRMYFTYNTTGPWHSDEPLPITDVLICTADLPSHPRPALLTVQPGGRHAAHPLAGTKVLAWLPNNWIAAQAREAGYDEAILLNERDEVSECTSANLFIARNGIVETPPLSSGCLPGVTREVLLELGAAGPVPVRERAMTLSDVMGADEVFMTSTLREVLAVSRIAGSDVANVNGPATEALARAFSEHVADTLS